MKNIEKKNSDHFKEFIYNRVSKTPSIRLLYALIVISNFLGDFSLLYEYVRIEFDADITWNLKRDGDR